MKKSIFLFYIFISSFIFAQNSEKNATHLDLYYSYIKGNNLEITDRVVELYIFDYHRTIYDRHRNDDFEWREKIIEYKKEFSENILKTDLNTLYVFQTSIRLGDYDFDNEGFKVNIGSGTFIPFRSEVGHRNPALRSVDLFLKDFDKFNFFKIDNKEANAFIKSRTKNNQVDRSVTLSVFFKIVDFSSVEYKNFVIDKTDREAGFPVLGNIIKIEILNSSKKIGELIKT
jgi:hypothetical protein